MILDAKQRLWFSILPKHVQRAKRLSKDDCVLAQALKDRPGIVAVLIGASVSTVTIKNRVTRYRTPPVLREALNHFDRTGYWGLPAADYFLDVMPPPAEKIKSKGKNIVRFYANGRKRRVPLNPRLIEFLKTKKAA